MQVRDGHARTHTPAPAVVVQPLGERFGLAQAFEHMAELAALDEHRLQLETDLEGPLQRVLALGEMRQRDERALEARNRLSVGRAFEGSCPSPAEMDDGLVPDLALGVVSGPSATVVTWGSRSSSPSVRWSIGASRRSSARTVTISSSRHAWRRRAMNASSLTVISSAQWRSSKIRTVGRWSAACPRSNRTRSKSFNALQGGLPCAKRVRRHSAARSCCSRPPAANSAWSWPPHSNGS